MKNKKKIINLLSAESAHSVLSVESAHSVAGVNIEMLSLFISLILNWNYRINPKYWDILVPYHTCPKI